MLAWFSQAIGTAYGDQESHSGEAAVCGSTKVHISCNIKLPVNDFMVNSAEPKHDQFDDWKTVVRKKGGFIKLANHLMLMSRQWKFVFPD